MNSALEDAGIRRKGRDPVRVRLSTLVAILIVVFLAGIGTGTLALSVRVTPNVVAVGATAVVSLQSPCDGWPQWSFDGYFSCAVTVSCAVAYESGYAVSNASAPGTSNFVVTPSLPVSIDCAAPSTIHVAGQLGYSGSVTIYLEIGTE